MRIILKRRNRYKRTPRYLISKISFPLILIFAIFNPVTEQINISSINKFKKKHTLFLEFIYFSIL